MSTGQDVEVLADWWYCGDEICQCSHPRIRRLTLPKHQQSDGCVMYTRGEVLEEGPWTSDGSDAAERRDQWRWMLDAARRHKVDNLGEIEVEAAEHLSDSTP